MILGAGDARPHSSGKTGKIKAPKKTQSLVESSVQGKLEALTLAETGPVAESTRASGDKGALIGSTDVVKDTAVTSHGLEPTVTAEGSVDSTAGEAECNDGVAVAELNRKVFCFL